MRRLIWGVIIIIIVIVISALNHLYLPYKTVNLENQMVVCENGTVKEIEGWSGLGNTTMGMQTSMTCLEYRTSRCITVCDKDLPSCKCEASMLDLLLYNAADLVV